MHVTNSDGNPLGRSEACVMKSDQPLRPLSLYQTWHDIYSIEQRLTNTSPVPVAKTCTRPFGYIHYLTEVLALKFCPFPTYFSQAGCSPNSDKTPHTHSPSPIETLHTLSFPPLLTLRPHSLHSRSSTTATHDFRCRVRITIYTFFEHDVIDRAHETFVGSDLYDCPKLR